MRFLLGLLMAAALLGGELRVERVFGPEIPTGPYKHPACITEFKNGNLYLVYYGGAGEYAVDTGVFGSRLKKGDTHWSAPKLIASDPFRSVGNGVIWQAPDGLVWLFYVVRWGDTWSTSRIQAKVSKDNGTNWSDSFVLAQDEGMMVRNKPIVLDSGEYLLPVYRETGHNTEVVGAGSTSQFLRFDPKTKHWSPSGIIRSKKGNIQPAVVQIDSKYLVAYCRRGGGYDPVKDGYIVRSESRDGGWNWTEGVDSKFPNPNSAIEFLKLKSGNLFLLYNDSMNDRTHLTAALSADRDKTWTQHHNIGEVKNPMPIRARFRVRMARSTPFIHHKTER
jgi:predicted neuraminidase